ncbi:MAG: ATP-binding protein [Candidatus Cloacimonadales bacterium]|nr:ATP-binding protein [Candidatus Cloacimonadales bacterium]
MNIFKKTFRKFVILILVYAVIIMILKSSLLPANSYYILFGFITFFVLLIAYFYIRFLTKPLEKIGSHLQQVSENKYYELPEITLNEFQQIFIDLNILTVRLKKYETKLSKHKEGFNIIIESIKEAIWIQDKKGLITISNNSFTRLVDQRNVKDQYFWNVIRNKELYDLSDRIFQNPANITEELDLKDSRFLASTSYSNLTGETVFILYDITEFRKLEMIKRDFVLNVSHELRTPLTSIKGYLETLEEELSKDQLALVDVIKRNTDRLINIVNDLLTLSRLEHIEDLEIEKITTADFLQNIVNIFEFRLKKKKIELAIDIQTRENYFHADRFKFEQVIINLIDNAIKYTKDGSIKVIVVENVESTIFEVLDSGSGINQKHLPRVFERFYVVDKSRSRKMGGTGLGLSIVKHIVNLHDGTIEIESEVGKGTKFKISIPKV